MTTNGDGRMDRGVGWGLKAERKKTERLKVIVVLNPLSASDLHPAEKHEAKPVEHLSVHQINMA